MAANIATINGRISMAYTGSTPWHNLGLRLPSITSVEQALNAGNLNWTVRKVGIQGIESGLVGQSDHVLIVRDGDNQIISTVGDGFEPLQNADAFGVLKDACAGHGVTIETVGALGVGERTWMLAKLPSTHNVTVGDADEVRGYFLIVNGFDGTTAYGGTLTPIRVVCQNTLTQALTGRHSTAFKIKHTRNMGIRCDEAKTLVDGMVKAMQQTGETFNRLAAKALNPTQLQEWVKSILPADLPKGEVSDTMKRKREEISALSFYGKGADLAGVQGDTTNLWMAYNAVCEWVDHVRPAEAKSKAGLSRANESAIFGSGADLKVQALRAAMNQLAA